MQTVFAVFCCCFYEKKKKKTGTKRTTKCIYCCFEAPLSQSSSAKHRDIATMAERKFDSKGASSS